MLIKKKKVEVKATDTYLHLSVVVLLVGVLSDDGHELRAVIVNQLKLVFVGRQAVCVS